MTDKAIKAARPSHNPRKDLPDGKPYKLSDSGSLYLEIMSTGGKLWRLKFRMDGREKRLALEADPDVTLADARDRRDDARRQLANGIDPSAAKKAKKQARADVLANSSEVIAREWHSLQVKDGARAIRKNAFDA